MSNQNRSKIGGGSGQDLLDGEFLGLSHSPPQFTPSSYEASHMHKVREERRGMKGMEGSGRVTVGRDAPDVPPAYDVQHPV